MAFKKNKKQGLFSKKVRKNEDAEFFYSANENEEAAGEISAENMDEILNIAPSEEPYDDTSDDEDNVYFPDNDMEDDAQDSDEADEFYEGSDEDEFDNSEDEELEDLESEEDAKEDEGMKLYTDEDGRLYFTNADSKRVYVTEVENNETSEEKDVEPTEEKTAEEESAEKTEANEDFDLYDDEESEISAEAQDEESDFVESEAVSSSEEAKEESESAYDSLNTTEDVKHDVEYMLHFSKDTKNESEESKMDKVIEASSLTVIGIKDTHVAIGNTTGKIEKMLSKHGEDYTNELSKAFETLIKSDPSAAATIYMAATVATLNTFDGDADKMADALDIDDRDITMAEYEFHARYNKQQ